MEYDSDIAFQQDRSQNPGKTISNAAPSRSYARAAENLQSSESYGKASWRLQRHASTSKGADPAGLYTLIPETKPAEESRIVDFSDL